MAHSSNGLFRSERAVAVLATTLWLALGGCSESGPQRLVDAAPVTYPPRKMAGQDAANGDGWRSPTAEDARAGGTADAPVSSGSGGAVGDAADAPVSSGSGGAAGNALDAPVSSGSGGAVDKAIDAPVSRDSEGPVGNAIDAQGAVVYGEHLTTQYRVLKVCFVRFGDDDGSNAAALSEANMADAIDAANSTFYQSGGTLRFVLDPSTSLTTIVKSTNFNNNCTPIPGWASSPHDADGNGVIDDTVDGNVVCKPLASNRDQSVANAQIQAIQAAGSIPVLVRGGFWSVLWNNGWRQHVGPGVGYYFSYLTMPEGFGADTSLVHELGHVFGLPHTFRDCVGAECSAPPDSTGSPATVAGIQQQILADVAAGKHDPKDSQGILAALFDGDRSAGMTDTPPDPNYKVWGSYFGDNLAKGQITHLCDPANQSMDVAVAFGAPYNTSYSYHLAPDRQDVMSYFKNCWGSSYHYYHFTPSQLTEVDVALGGKMAFLSKTTGTTDLWQNSMKVDIPVRAGANAPLAWGDSTVSVTGVAPPAKAALVYLTLQTTTGNYHLELVAPNGTVYTLQTPSQNDGSLFPVIAKTMYAVDLSATSVPANGDWTLRVANESVVNDDPSRSLDNWQLELR